MSLKLLSPGAQPLSFDVVDSELTSFKGGEVVTLTSLALSGSDKAAKDVFDGYTLPSSVQKRVAVTKTLSSGKRPLMLADDGIAGYGTLFGSVVGGSVGQVVSGSSSVVVLGPSSATGSGKLTCWDKPGLYAVSLDAVDTTASTGLVTGNTSLDSGSALYATAAGLLTPNSGAAFESVVVGRFVSFETNGSLVTSSNNMVTALNSPSGTVEQTRQFAFATFHFNPGV